MGAFGIRWVGFSTIFRIRGIRGGFGDLDLLDEEEGRVGCGFIKVERWAVIGGRCEPRISDVDGLDGFGCAPPFKRKNKMEIDADH